ncbi:hypothetical protein [Streptomyces misionensis]|uniref:hypothetical protein n=1 Tax=Streptomyces misionensis TaxID=67331 RepID=UPI0033F11429
MLQVSKVVRRDEAPGRCVVFSTHHASPEKPRLVPYRATLDGARSLPSGGMRPEIWPQRRHQVPDGNAETDLERWQIVGRDAVVFPEVTAVADALLDPAMAELAWADSCAGPPRALPADGAFCRQLEEQVGHTWLEPLSAVDYGGPLIAWMGAVIRQRRGEGGPPGDDNNPWWVRQEHQLAAMGGQLRVLGNGHTSPGSGTTWHAAVPAERRALITGLVNGAQEQLAQLRGVHSDTTAEVARTLLQPLVHSAALIGQALLGTAAATVAARVALTQAPSLLSRASSAACSARRWTICRPCYRRDQPGELESGADGGVAASACGTGWRPPTSGPRRCGKSGGDHRCGAGFSGVR